MGCPWLDICKCYNDKCPVIRKYWYIIHNCSVFRPVSFHITNITSTWFICFVSHVCSAGSVWMFVQIRYYDGMVLCGMMIQQYNLFDPWIRDAVFVILVWNYYSINYNFVHQSKFTYSTFLWILNFFKYTLCVPGFFCVKNWKFNILTDVLRQFCRHLTGREGCIPQFIGEDLVGDKITSFNFRNL